MSEGAKTDVAYIICKPGHFLHPPERGHHGCDVDVDCCLAHVIDDINGEFAFLLGLFIWSTRNAILSGGSIRSFAVLTTHMNIRVMFRSGPVTVSKKFLIT